MNTILGIGFIICLAFFSALMTSVGILLYQLLTNADEPQKSASGPITFYTLFIVWIIIWICIVLNNPNHFKF